MKIMTVHHIVGGIGAAARKAGTKSRERRATSTDHDLPRKLYGATACAWRNVARGKSGRFLLIRSVNWNEDVLVTSKDIHRKKKLPRP